MLKDAQQLRQLAAGLLFLETVGLAIHTAELANHAVESQTDNT